LAQDGSVKANRILTGDCRETLRELPDGSVQCCVTSPPYYGLRDYGVDGQIGMEPTLQEYVAAIVAVFAEVKRTLARDGVLWLNLGDTYASTGGDHGASDRNQRGVGAARTHAAGGGDQGVRRPPSGLKAKDLIGVPWRVAFALQADGWYLRQDVIWSKPNPMPESVTDRCTKAHEYVFLLAKSERYYFQAKAIAEPAIYAGATVQNSSSRMDGLGKHGATRAGFKGDVKVADTRNRRSVWTVATQPFDGAHFATMPEELATLCVLSGSRPGDVVLDPFFGSGTVGKVAEQLGRQWIGCELNQDYADIARVRTAQIGIGI
jgi:DNA modification methylase